MAETKRKAPAIIRPTGATQYPSYLDYAFFQPPASPVIPILNRDLPELREPVRLVLPQFFPLVPFVQAGESAANPVIPFLNSELIQSGPQAVIQPKYGAFPYFEQPANPVPEFSIGRPGPESPLPLVRPQFFQFPFVSTAVASANPVPPILKGQWIGDATIPLVGRSSYTAFPFVSNPSVNPLIPLRKGQWINDAAPQWMGRPSYIQFPFVSVSIATANPVIQFRQGQWIGTAPAAVPNMSQYQRIPYWQINRTIPYIYGQWIGDAIQQKPIAPAYFRWAPFNPPSPASPVIPYIKGQWIGQAVPPLVGIKGHLPFPWFSPIPSNTEPYWRATVQPPQTEFDPTERVLQFPARFRRFRMDA